eukprot:4644910-Lingulodinium_polyedra.AAC.1
MFCATLRQWRACLSAFLSSCRARVAQKRDHTCIPLPQCRADSNPTFHASTTIWWSTRAVCNIKH